MKYRSLAVQFVCLILLFTAINAKANNDSIVEFSVQKSIGFEEVPLVQIEVELSKTRDLHVAVQNMDGWQTVKRAMKRVNKSGKYHFEIPVDNLKPGQYRIDAYLTPKGKDWNDRLGETIHQELRVLNQAKLVESANFSARDKVKMVDFPKQVIGKEDVNLRVIFDITAARDLHLKLLNSDNQQELGALKFPVTTPGDMSLPLSNMTDDFPPGNYSWVIYLSETGKTTPIVEKYGKYFILKATQ